MTGKSGRDIEIFTEAVQLPIEERVAFLDRACADDKDLRQRIEALLKSNDRVGAFLEQPPAAAIDEVRAKAAAGEKPGGGCNRHSGTVCAGVVECGVHS